MRRLEINGGQVNAEPSWLLRLPAGREGYADAQIDDYGGRRRRHYLWRPGTTFRCRARFSHRAGELAGTAGFGFWNAPFGDPTVPWPALPQAAWFFYASKPSDLPLAANGPGRGWFASTLDAATPRALAMTPLAPLVLLLNQFAPLRRRIWPAVQKRLGISFAPIEAALDKWHTYELHWLKEGCEFYVDGRLLLHSSFSPHGPLGFVCWIDNQYLVTTSRGRLRWGVCPQREEQWLALEDLHFFY